jgi:hypothetical protein
MGSGPGLIAWRPGLIAWRPGHCPEGRCAGCTGAVVGRDHKVVTYWLAARSRIPTPQQDPDWGSGHWPFSLQPSSNQTAVTASWCQWESPCPFGCTRSSQSRQLLRMRYADVCYVLYELPTSAYYMTSSCPQVFFSPGGALITPTCNWCSAGTYQSSPNGRRLPSVPLYLGSQWPEHRSYHIRDQPANPIRWTSAANQI